MNFHVHEAVQFEIIRLADNLAGRKDPGNAVPSFQNSQGAQGKQLPQNPFDPLAGNPEFPLKRDRQAPHHLGKFLRIFLQPLGRAQKEKASLLEAETVLLAPEPLFKGIGEMGGEVIEADPLVGKAPVGVGQAGWPVATG